jgi:hypothetical protein
MIKPLAEEVLIEVLVRMGRYRIDDEVFEEAKRLYGEKIALMRINKKEVLHY